jgi:NADPH2:quinone reductase
MKAIRVHQHGGPEVLHYEDAPEPKPGVGEALVQVYISGVNFVDTYYRTGLYKPASLPYTPGSEASGVVSAVAEGVTEVKAGDRVAYATHMGSYAEFAVVPAWKLVKVPPEVDFKTAAALPLQGMTAHYLVYSTFPLQPGQCTLIHAGAGGVGLLLIQMARKLGATVYATVGNAATAERARRAGANQTINYSEQDFEAEVKKLTNGRGVDVVYDSVGAATFQKSLNSLRPRGMMVSYGNASGPVPPLDPIVLSAKGSLFLTRPNLASHIASREEVQWRAGDIFKWAASGELKVKADHIFSLADAARAHRELEGRRTTGKVLLMVRD